MLTSGERGHALSIEQLKKNQGKSIELRALDISYPGILAGLTAVPFHRSASCKGMYRTTNFWFFKFILQHLWFVTKLWISLPSVYSHTHTPAQMEVFGPAVCSYTGSFHSIIISQTSTHRTKIQNWIALCLCREIYASITLLSPSFLLLHFFFRTINQGSFKNFIPLLAYH